MGNYTSKSQKVEMYSKKYNLSEKEVYRILSESEVNLSLEELKIKYDDMEIGKLPQWLVDEGGYEKLEEYIDKGVRTKFNYRFEYWTTVEELKSDAWEFILKRIHKYNSGAHIITAVKNRVVTLGYYESRRQRVHPVSLQDPSNNKDEKLCWEDMFGTEDDIGDGDGELLQLINSIPNKSLRGLIIIVGYLNGVTALHDQFYEVLACSDKKVQDELYKLLQKYIDIQDKQIQKDENTVKANKKTPQKITLKSVIKATKYGADSFVKINERTNQPVNFSNAEIKDEIIYYLKEHNLIQNLNKTYSKARSKKQKELKHQQFIEKYKDIIVPQEQEEEPEPGECIIIQDPDLAEKYLSKYSQTLKANETTNMDNKAIRKQEISLIDNDLKYLLADNT